MNEKDQLELQDRVERERIAHDVDGVLENSYRLKGRFSHVMNNPAYNSMLEELDKVVECSGGLKVLDLGCGFGADSHAFSNAGASVTGIDISVENIRQCQERFQGIDFRIMDAHELEFERETFDLVFGRGILHHLDYARTLREVNRVLKVGGRAVFQEPLGGNPLLKLFRFLTPRARTPDERPLVGNDLKLLQETWSVQNQYYGLVNAPAAMVTSIIAPNSPDNWFARATYTIERVFVKLNWLKTWHQYVIIDVIKSEEGC